MIRQTSIRKSLLINVLLLVTILSVTILSITYYGSRHILKSLIESLIDETINEVNTHLTAFFEPVVAQLHIVQKWNEQDLINLYQREKLTQIIAPILSHHTQISSFLLANNQGDEYMLLHHNHDWVNRETRPTEWREKSKWYEWQGSGVTNSFEWKTLNYNPRQRPWFIGALQKFQELKPQTPPIENSVINWTEPYIFFTTKEPGITVSIAHLNSQQQLNVIGFDILLKDLTKFTSSLSISPNGKVLVVTPDRSLIGLPKHSLLQTEDQQKQAYLKSPNEIGLPLLSKAVQAYDKLPASNNTAFRFMNEGQAWWGGVKGFALAPDRKLGIAVILPESDVLNEVYWLQLAIVLICFLTLALAVLRTIGLARRYSTPIESLMQESNRISQGDLEKRISIESNISEVSQLASAHDQMRRGLKSLLKLETDLLLARQIQQNTLPKNLPNLDNFEIDAWSTPAEQTGGDTYDVIYLPIDKQLSARSQTDIQNNLPNRTTLLLADATGHGIGPALSVSQVRAMLRMAVRDNADLQHIVVNMNAQLCDDLHAGRFITAWIAELLDSQKLLCYFSAGLAPLLYYKATHDICEELGADGAPLGILPEYERPVVQQIQMQRGDIFAVFSDGIIEANNSGGEQFSIHRVKQIIQQHRSKTASEIANATRHALAHFCGESIMRDDQTGMIVKCK